MLSHRENFLRNARLLGPEYIPCTIHLPHAMLAQGGSELEGIMARHKRYFPNFQPGKIDFDNYPFPVEERRGEMIDPWGCTWRMAYDGVIGSVVAHPLADWSALAGFQPPPVVPMSAQQSWGDWSGQTERIKRLKERGQLAVGNVYHGFFFMRLTYLRGFENLMYDLIDEPPELARLMRIIQDHTAEVIRHWLDMGVDVVHFGEDLGTQNASIVSPEMFARHFTPIYTELFAPIRQAGTLVWLHSDGHVTELMDEFEAAAVDIINPQDLVNGIDELARTAKGRFCIDLDVDRQSVVPFGSPGEIHDLIEEEVRKLGSPAGGLMLKVSVYPPAPLENVEALCRAFEKFRTYFWD